MSKASDLILLLEMSHSEAMKILGIQAGDDVHKAYKEMAMKHHPDKGGSTEMMQKINQAYQLLKGMKTSTYSKQDYEKQQREYEEKQRKKMAERKAMIEDLEKQFRKYIKDYKDHFAEFFKLKDEPVIKTDISSYYFSTGYLYVFWFSEDGKTEIRLTVTLAPETGGSLANPDVEDTQYSIDYRTELYHARGLHKMMQRRWSDKKLSSFVFDPEKVFPKAKLKKIIDKPVKTKMKRSEFNKALNSEVKKIGGDWFNDTFIFDLGRPDDIVVTMYRSVYGGKASWFIWYRKGERNPKTGKFWKLGVGSPKMADLPELPAGFPESSLSIDMLMELIKMIKAGESIPKDYFKPAWDSMKEEFKTASRLLDIIGD